MKKIGFDSITEYKFTRPGNFSGNTSINPISIFNFVTYNLPDLISRIEIFYANGKKITVLEDEFDVMAPRTVSSLYYGRCYEFALQFKHESPIIYFSMLLKRDLEIYFEFPLQFYANSKTRFFAKYTEKMSIQVTYEIMKFNYDKTCRKYSLESFDGSFDQCKMTDIERKIQSEFNCTIPFFMKPGNYCLGAVAVMANDMFDDMFTTDSLKCPRSCYKIVPVFGIPKRKPPTQWLKPGIKIYLNNDIKVTEDFVSYDLLRSDKK